LYLLCLYLAGGSIDASSFSPEDEEALNETLGELLVVLEQLDERIGPMLEQDGAHFNKRCAVLLLLCSSVVKLSCTVVSTSACIAEFTNVLDPCWSRTAHTSTRSAPTYCTGRP
jgi:hypothetical protein